MTSHTVKGEHALSCDGCPEIYESPRRGRGSAPREWAEMWEDAKRAGWRAVKRGDGWRHFCPDCVRNHRQER